MVIAAVQAAMDEAVPRFAPMHKATCPHLEETAGGLAGSVRSISAGCRAQYIPVSVVRRVDSATTSSVSAAASAAGSRIRDCEHTVHSFLVGGLVGTEWGGNGAALGHIPITGSVGSRNGHVVRRVRTLLARGGGRLSRP